MKNLIYLFIIVIYCQHVKSQELPHIDYSLLNKENLEYSALKQDYYIVSQEYTLISKDSEHIIRGGKSYFGRTSTIGILTMDNKLWFPGFIRTPWKSDPNFKDYARTHIPKCTMLRIKALNLEDISDNFSLENNLLDTTKSVLSFKIGIKGGCDYSSENIQRGTLVTFYSSIKAPHTKSDINYSISSINNLEWNPDGISTLPNIPSGEQFIVGGALYQRIIKPAQIEWKLAGFLTFIDDKWVIQSIQTLL